MTPIRLVRTAVETSRVLAVNYNGVRIILEPCAVAEDCRGRPVVKGFEVRGGRQRVWRVLPLADLSGISATAALFSPPKTRSN